VVIPPAEAQARPAAVAPGPASDLDDVFGQEARP
jgi:hypothetical protein